MATKQPQSTTAGSAEEIVQYLEELLGRDRFRKSPSLHHLLEYLVRTTVDGRVEEIKESIIAIDVFGRSHDFDGRLDNIVRVQAHRLRKTLDAYYAGEGADDRLTITIPKGSYVPSIGRRDERPVFETIVQPEAEPDRDDLETPLPVASQRTFPRLALVSVFLAGSLIASLLTWTVMSLRIASVRTPTVVSDGRRPPLSALWAQFLKPGVECVVSFTNPVFLGTQAGPNRVYTTYQGPMSAPAGSRVEIRPGDSNVHPELIGPGRSFFFSESWTGVGEVFGMHRLTRFFAEAGHSLKVVRSRALSYADLRDANVIFLGSPWANDLQDKIHPGRTPLSCLGSVRIDNSSPRSGEPASFEPVYDPRTKALTTTYALLSVLPGVTLGTKVLSSAGIDTYGTSAGVDFLTSGAGVASLVERLDLQARRLPEFFQAVIRVEIVRGDPARSTLVLAREIDHRSLTDSRLARLP